MVNTPGILTTQSASTSNAILVDYKDTIQRYKTVDLPVVQIFGGFQTSRTGGDISLTFEKQSMEFEEVEEGTAPSYQHTDYRTETVTVKEWALAIGVTRRMIEDSRWDEVANALAEARRAYGRLITKQYMDVIFGVSGSHLAAALTNATTEASITGSTYGGWYGSGAVSTSQGRLEPFGDKAFTSGHVSHYVNSSAALKLSAITSGIQMIGEHGYNADTLMISPDMYKTLLDFADFTQVFADIASGSSKGGLDYVNDVSRTGLVGQLYGLRVFVNAWVPSTRYGVFDTSVKPVAHVERRALTFEEANPGFGMVGSYLSERHGIKIIRPDAGVIFY